MSDLGWSQLLTDLDRHADWGLPSPDRASLAELMRIFDIPGASFAVGSVDSPLWTMPIGTTDGATPVTADTAFQACSISKHVAAFATLRLVDDGRLELDADIDEYLTSWHLPSGGPRVTLRQLLAHTAGLTDNWFRGYRVGRPTPTLLQILRGEPPANTPPVRVSLLPGSRFRYSGSHYAVLQQLLVDVTGEAFEELLQRLVFGPLDLRDSSFDQKFPDRRPELTALGHATGGATTPGGWHVIPEQAGAGLWSTPSDLLRFDLELLRASQGRSALLSRELANEMITVALPGCGYGLGTRVDDAPGRRRFGHTGGGVGYGCLVFVWPEVGTGIAFMTNSEDCRELILTVLTTAIHRYATPLPVQPVGDRSGRYELRDGYAIQISSAGGRLTLTAPGQSPVDLEPLASGHYRHPRLDLELRFHPVHDGSPADGPAGTAVDLVQEGVVQTATRT